MRREGRREGAEDGRDRRIKISERSGDLGLKTTGWGSLPNQTLLPGIRTSMHADLSAAVVTHTPTCHPAPQTP